MYVEPMGGMGNRFNCIISAIVISRAYGYKLNIVWNRDLDEKCYFACIGTWDKNATDYL